MLKIFKNIKRNKVNLSSRKNIKMRRLLLEIKQEEISEATNISIKQIQKYEQNINIK